MVFLPINYKFLVHKPSSCPKLCMILCIPHGGLINTYELTDKRKTKK